jgi:hypothetical protein
MILNVIFIKKASVDSYDKLCQISKLRPQSQFALPTVIL